MSWTIRIGTFVVSIWLSTSCYSIETNPFVALNVLDNKPTGIVHSIEVNQGVIWLGTDNGVFAIEGDQTFHYELGSDATSSLVYDLKAGQSEDIWIASFGGGLSRISKLEGIVKTITEAKGLKSNFLTRLLYFEQDLIITSSVSGFQLYDIKADVLHSFEDYFELDLRFEEEGDIEKIDEKSFVTIDTSGAYVFDVESKKITKLNLPNKILNSEVNKIFVQSPEILWLSTSVGVYKYDLTLDLLQKTSIKTPNNIAPKDFISGLEGELLVAAEGLYLYDEASQQLVESNFLSPFLNNGTISVITDLESTSSGMILLSGPVFGLTWIPETYGSITYLHHESESIKGKVENVIYLEEQNFLAVVSGQLFFSPAALDGELVKIKLEQEISFRDTVSVESKVYAVDHNGILHDITYSDRRASVTKIDTNYRFLDIKAFSNQLIGITEKYDIFALKDRKIELTRIPDFKPDISFTSNDLVVYVDYFNKILISNDMISWVELDASGLQESIPIDCVEKTVTGTVYFCTGGEGILTIEPETSRLIPSKLNQSIDSKYVRAIKSDKNGFLWISTNTGLFRADPFGNWAQRVGQKDGVIDVDFEYEGLYLSTEKERLIIVGDKLSYVIDLQSYNTVLNSYLDKKNTLYINNIRNFSGSGEDKGYIANTESTDQGERVVIENNAYLTEISFAATDAIDHKYLEFEYRLLGLNDAWRKATKGNASATFSTLPFGQYTFEARAIDQQSLAEQPITSIDIRVLPPVWLTVEAFIFYFLALIFMYLLSVFWQRSLESSTQAEIDSVVNEKTSTLVQKYEATTKLLENKRTMFSNLSHEMRTPLTIVLGWLSHFRQSGKFKAVDDKLVAMQDNTYRLKILVDQLLELERLENNVLLPMKSYDVHQTMIWIIESYKPLTQEKYIEVILKGKRKLQVNLSEGAFEKIFSNILSNAIKYSPKESTINVYVREKKGIIEVSVSDSGDGIDEADQEQIFERFSRLQKHEGLNGTGIGLAVVKELVSANNGSIELFSELGVGTTFTVKLPLSERSSSATYKPDSQIVEHQVAQIKTLEGEPEIEDIEFKSGNKTILIVDDSEEVRDYIFTILSGSFNCIRAVNGKEGFEIATNMLPDAIVTDFVMPKMDGLQMTKRLREQDVTSHIPIIIVSAKGEEQSRIAGLEAKADDYLVKPFNDRELILKVTQLMRTRDAIADKYFEEHKKVFASPNIAEARLPEFKNERDQRFYTTLLLTTYKNYTNDNYSRDDAANALNCTDRQLNRKLNALIDSNFTNFLKVFRLEQAKKLLLATGKVGNVAYDVGFASPSYFGACFKNEYGETPREYIDRNKPDLEKNND